MSRNLTNIETEEQHESTLFITREILIMIITEALNVYDIKEHFNPCKNLINIIDIQRSAYIFYHFKDYEKPIEFILEIDIDCCEGIEEPTKTARIWVEGYEMARLEFSEKEASILEHSETFLSELINHAL